MYVVASRHFPASHFGDYNVAYNAAIQQAVTYREHTQAYAVPSSLIVTFKESKVFVSVIDKHTNKLLNWWILTEQSRMRFGKGRWG